MTEQTLRLQDFLAKRLTGGSLGQALIRERAVTMPLYREKCALQWAPPEQIDEYVQRRLRVLLAVAAETPYYGDELRRLAVVVDDFEVSELPRLPLLTKDCIRTEMARLVRGDAAGLFENYSGGSTGQPITFFQDLEYVRQSRATIWISDGMAGWYPGARVARLVGAPQDIREAQRPASRIKRYLNNRRFFDTFNMSPERMREYHQELDAFQPELVVGYASSIHLMAEFLRQSGMRPTYPSRGIITSAEVLSQEMRTVIEEVFPARVFDRYGSREINAIASECEAHDGLHIHSYDHVVECIDPDSQAPLVDQPGELVVTNLNNHGMPFIRYRIGDKAILTRRPCLCGRTTPRLLRIIGRTTDNFRLHDGRLVHGEYFTHVFYGFPGVKQFQFVQEDVEAFTLKLVVTPEFSREALDDGVLAEIRDFVGGNLSIDVQLVSEIPPTASGKHLFTVSKLDSRERPND